MGTVVCRFRLVEMVRPRFTASIAISALVVAQGCARNRPRQPPPIQLTQPMSFTVTAYCAGKTTAAGTRVTEGVVAADPGVLPLGTVIRLAGLDGRYNGTYTVMDTGPKVPRPSPQSVSSRLRRGRAVRPPIRPSVDRAMSLLQRQNHPDCPEHRWSCLAADSRIGARRTGAARALFRRRLKIPAWCHEALRGGR